MLKVHKESKMAVVRVDKRGRMTIRGGWVSETQEQ